MFTSRNQTALFFGIALSTSVIAGGCGDAASVGKTASEIDEFVASWHEANRFNGSVLVAERGEIIYERGFGYADIANRIENRPDTRFRIGSISKQFTTVLVFQLAAEGLIDLDGRVSEYLPEYRRDTGDRVTIDHLLRHTSGIPGYIIDRPREPYEERDVKWCLPYDREYLIREYMSGDLLFEPGSRYKYCNTGFFLLHVIIERVTGISFEENLRRRILDPLGLVDTGLNRPGDIVENRANGYHKVPGGFREAYSWYPPNIYGAGGMYSTVRDLLTWNLALERDALLGAQWREKMFTPYLTEGGAGYAYSITYESLRLSEEPPLEIEVTSFSGGMPGFVTNVFRFPETGHIIAVLDNSSQLSLWSIAYGAYRIIRGFESQPAKPQAADLLAEIAVEEGVEAAVRRYRELQEHGSEVYQTGDVERELGELGYNLLRARELDAAIAVFNLNAELYPSSADVHHQLAEAYLRAGDRQQSTGFAARASELENREGELLALIRAGEYEAARNRIEAIRRREPEVEIFASYNIGPLFGQAFSEERNDDAEAICTIWMLGNPTAVGPYFSLARVYRQLGDTERAGECYETILEISDNNDHQEAARRALEEIRPLLPQG